MKTYNLIIKGECNTNCSFCNFYETKKRVNYIEHFLDLKNEIDKVYIEGYKKIFIGFYGYEPTTFPYIEEILSYIKNKNFFISLNTNGVLFSKYSFLEKIYIYLDEVYITIYSINNNDHYLYTQKKQNYLIKHKAILNIIKFKLDLNIQILILKNNVYKIDEFINQIKKYYKYTQNVNISFTSTEMDNLRFKVLVPTYSDIIKSLNESKELIDEKITISTDMPLCLQGFIKKDLLNQIQYNNDSLSSKYIYINKCDSCIHKKNNLCMGLNKNYYNFYGEDEISKNKFIFSSLLSNKEIYNNINLAKSLYKK